MLEPRLVCSVSDTLDISELAHRAAVVARCSRLSRALAPLRAVMRDQRGANSVEYAILVGIVALGLTGGARAFWGKLQGVITREGVSVRTFEPSGPGSGSDGATEAPAITLVSDTSSSGDDSGRSSRDPRDRDRSRERERVDRGTPERARNPSGRSPGERQDRDRDSWFDNDWAGREILNRYLVGGDDWYIKDEERWTNYMTSDPALTDQVQARTDQVATTLYQQYLASGATSAPLDVTFHASIENGEGINGHQYLHGTNNKVGDFHIGGDATITPRPDGGYDVTIDGAYAWNDIIDPNDQYATDTAKSRFAEIVTLGQADPYRIQIAWHKQTTIHLDASGQITGSEGWP